MMLCSVCSPGGVDRRAGIAARGQAGHWLVDGEQLCCASLVQYILLLLLLFPLPLPSYYTAFILTQELFLFFFFF